MFVPSSAIALNRLISNHQYSNHNNNTNNNSSVSSTTTFFFFPLDSSNLTTGPPLPLNILRAFVDSAESLLLEFESSSPSGSQINNSNNSKQSNSLPKFFDPDFNIFESVKHQRRGHPQTSLIFANTTQVVDDQRKRKIHPSATSSTSSLQQQQQQVIKPGVVPEIINDTNNFATVFTDCQVRGGRWYYECTLKTQGLMQIGWCIPAKCVLTASSFFATASNNDAKKKNNSLTGGNNATSTMTTPPPSHVGVGDDTFSIGIDLFRRIRWFGGMREQLSTNNNNTATSTRRWAAGDVLGTSIDFDNPVESERKIVFYLNGVNVHEVLLKSIGFDIDSLMSNNNEQFDEGSFVGAGVSPAFSLRPGNHIVVNFGSRPQRFKPEGFRSMAVPDGLLERIESHYKSISSPSLDGQKITSTSTSSSPVSTCSSLLDRIHVVESASKNLDSAKLKMALDEVTALKTGAITSTTNSLTLALQLFDRLVQSCIPLIEHDDEQHRTMNSSTTSNNVNLLSRIVLASRSLMIPSTRSAIANRWLKETATRGEDLRLALNRNVAIRRQKEGNVFLSLNNNNSSSNNTASSQQHHHYQRVQSDDPHALRTLFGQTFSLLRNTVHPRALRTDQHRAWTVVFVGEGAEDVGGPFREHMSTMCSEIMSGFACPLFMPSPNSTQNVGSRRDAVIVNPFFFSNSNDRARLGVELSEFSHLTNEIRQDMFRFFGVVLGVALRGREPLSLSMTTHFWKALCKEECDLEHDTTDTLLKQLESFDVTSAQSLRRILEMREIGDKELFDESFGYESLPFNTVLLSNGETFDIVKKKLISGSSETAASTATMTMDDDGEQQEQEPVQHVDDKFVTFENAENFVRLSVCARLLESKCAIDACREGLTSIVPATTLFLLGAADLELRICGRPDFTAAELKSMTVFESIQTDDTRTEFLWKFIDDITPAQRRLFLRFVSGRERLPVKLKVLPMSSSAPNHQRTQANDTSNNNKNEDPDVLLPRAATCFFALELPQYSCYSVFKTKLLFAITHCWEIDTDFRARDLDGAGGGGEGTMLIHPQTTTTTHHHHHHHHPSTTVPPPAPLPANTANPSSTTTTSHQPLLHPTGGSQNNLLLDGTDGASSTQSLSPSSSPTNLL